VIKEFRAAAAAANKDWFALDSTRQQLLLLRDLGFRPEQVSAALDAVEKEIARSVPPYQPRNVFLFSGHMIDGEERRDGRKPPRFPPHKEQSARAAIAEKLESLTAGPEDLAICGGACGGDTLFLEACRERGLRLQIHIQYEEPEFLKASVGFAGVDWVERFYRLKEYPNASVLVMPDELGPVPRGVNTYERNNLWQLYTALSFGPEKVRFLGLWNGEGGDGPGGTKHMVETVERHSGRAYIIDTRTLH
jgi:hypothetical protein